MDPPSESTADADREAPVRPRPYPVVLHLTGVRCLVVGGGPVAARKAAGLVEAGADVTVVAPEPDPGVRALGVPGPRESGVVTVAARPYRSPEAADYRLVVTATGDPEVDRRVAEDAAAGGALVNRADTGGHDRGAPVGATVTLPAVLRDGPVTVAVSTDGASPAFARWLRDRLAASLDPGVGALAVLAEEARSAHRGAGSGAGAVDWSGAFDRVAPLVAAGRLDEARALLAQLVGGDPGVTPTSGGSAR
jgi:siroheme synthase-like protein